jgi:hypothetical protein
MHKGIGWLWMVGFFGLLAAAAAQTAPASTSGAAFDGTLIEACYKSFIILTNIAYYDIRGALDLQGSREGTRWNDSLRLLHSCHKQRRTAASPR